MAPRLGRWSRLLLVAGLVVGTTLVVGGGVASAYPSAPVATPVSPVRFPGGMIVSIVGNVLPEAGAARTAGLALENGANGAINTAGLGTAFSVAKWVPGFKLGYKTGEWIAQATGLYDTTPQYPDAQFTPYENLVKVDPGWVGGSTAVGVFATTNGGHRVPSDGGIQFQCSAIPGLVAGQSIDYHQPLMQCDGSANTVPGGVADAFGLGGDGKRNAAINCAYLFANNPHEQGGGLCNDRLFNGGGPTTVILVGQTEVVPDGIRFCGAPIQSMCTHTDTDGWGPQYWDATMSTYWFVGAKQRQPADPNADHPLRQLRTTITCRSANSTATAQSQFWTTGFREDATTLPPPVPGTCSGGSFLVGSSLDMVDSKTQKVIRHLNDYAAPVPYQTWMAENPNCWDAGCAVNLVKKPSTVKNPATTKTNCFDNSAGCENWFDEPNKEDLYQCEQNGKVLALSDCNMYSPTFDPTRYQNGIRYGDPATGASPAPSTTPMDSGPRQPIGVTPAQAVDQENATPAPQSSTAPKPGGYPGPVAPSNPTAAPTPTHTPVPTPTNQVVPDEGNNTTPAGSEQAAEGGTSCMGEGWSWNPLSWVYVPVKCAVQWAFVPAKGAITDAFAGVQAAWTTSGPGRWAGYLGQVMAGTNVGQSGGCSGPAVSIGATKFTPNLSFHPLDACSAPMSTIAGIVKVILVVGLWFGAFFVSARVVLGALGINVMSAFGKGDGAE